MKHIEVILGQPTGDDYQCFFFRCLILATQMKQNGCTVHQDVAELIKIYKVSGQGTKDKHLDTGNLRQAANREHNLYAIIIHFVNQKIRTLPHQPDELQQFVFF